MSFDIINDYKSINFWTQLSYQLFLKKLKMCSEKGKMLSRFYLSHTYFDVHELKGSQNKLIWMEKEFFVNHVLVAEF